jgi:hypothetical protein
VFWETRHSSHESDHFNSFCGKSQRTSQNLITSPERLVMIRRHYGDALVLMASFTGGSILMFGP